MFTKVKAFLEELNILHVPDLASRLWNADETGFCTSVTSGQVLACKGARDVHETSGGSGWKYFTVLAVGDADGTRLPPFISKKVISLYLCRVFEKTKSVNKIHM